jgi:hypothetical protein
MELTIEDTTLMKSYIHPPGTLRSSPIQADASRKPEPSPGLYPSRVVDDFTTRRSGRAEIILHRKQSVGECLTRLSISIFHKRHPSPADDKNRRSPAAAVYCPSVNIVSFKRYLSKIYYRELY